MRGDIGTRHSQSRDRNEDSERACSGSATTAHSTCTSCAEGRACKFNRVSYDLCGDICDLKRNSGEASVYAILHYKVSELT